MVFDKCAQECSGEEEKLLSFKDSCVAIENVFGCSQYGAGLFLSGLARLKHRRLLDLLFSGNASRTIETLFYALRPIQEDQHVELLEKFSDLLCDNWNDAVGCQHSAFLIRCFARLACGLGKKQEKVSTYCHVFVEDLFTKFQFFLELRQLWCGKNSSRVWEKLVISCREEMLHLLWTNIVAKHVLELASHPSANFPLQKFIANVKSLELVTNTCLFSFFLVVALLQCAANHELLQEPILKELRKFFRASTDDWEPLISDVYGSHVFESIWTCSLYNVKRRQDLMKKLVPIHNDSKFWKFAMLRCDMYLFRKDRKAWVEKMKKSIKETERQN
uniref:E3 ubiquitin-protein ligase listerin n=1 Tax=Angiostrongylus cantonensis TaxID=6313 RepID=A0A0K0DF52_ANGCA